MSKSIERIGIVAGATVISRILGLTRDCLFMAVLGASALSSAFILAFTLPNLFRRLLGEGAMTSALVPLLAERMERSGAAPATALLNRVLTRLAISLTALLLAALLLVAALLLLPNLEERWLWGGRLSLLLLPYLVPVCLAAILAAALNLHHRFAVAALSQVWLNAAMITACLLGLWLTEDAVFRVYLICCGVLLGGCLQLLIPAHEFGKAGLGQLKPDFSDDPALPKLWLLLLPGLAGAAVIQVNVAISRLLAFSLDESATAILYLANRLVELPLGIFAIAITTVLFPQISRAAAQGDETSFAKAFHHGLRLILAITLPAAVGLVLMAHPILDFLFKWGAFKAKDVYATVPILIVYAAGIPAYALGTYLTRAFHARQDTRSPMQLAIINLIANLLGGLLLMQPLGATGLALANVLAMLLHVILLGKLLQKQTSLLNWHTLKQPLQQILAATTTMALLTIGLQWLATQLTATLTLWTKFYLLFYITTVITLAITSYTLALKALHFPEIEEILNSLTRKTRAR